MNNSSSHPNSMQPPSPLGQDYIRACINALCFVIGLPINLFTLFKQFRQRKSTSVYGRPSLVHINLNISDVMTLIFYSFAQFCWFLTWKWNGGDVGCRLLHFSQSISFSSSSNIMVCIAVSRLRAMTQPLHVFTYEAKEQVKKWLCGAWLLALVTSVPQLFVYKHYILPGGWGQCVTIWFTMWYENSLTETMRHLSDAYNISHLLVLFWIPLIFLLICYALLIRTVFHTARSQKQSPTPSFRQAAAIPLREIGSTNPVTSGDGSTSRCSTASSGVDTGLRLVSGLQSREKARTRALRVTLLLLSLYFIFWAPYNGISLWMTLDIKSYQQYQNQIFIALALELVVINSVLNPLVYGSLKMSDLKKPTRKSHREKLMVSDPKRRSTRSTFSGSREVVNIVSSV